MNRSAPLRPCGKRFDTAEEAGRYKRVLSGDLLVSGECRVCGGFHAVRASEAKAPALKPGAGTGPDLATRLAVYARDGWACVCCGISIVGRRRSVGHRIRRSQGGTSDMTNLLTFLGLGNGMFPDDHHYRIDSRVDPADHAAGYQLESWQDPAAEGVLYVSADGSGVLAWLEADGGLSFEAPALAAGGAS